MIALLWIALSACAPTQVACGERAPEARDACWAEAAVEANGDTDAREALAAIVDPPTRDLAWIAAVRAGHALGCDGIVDRTLRDACRDLVARPHLGIGTESADAREAAPARGAQAGAAAAPDAACASLATGLSDACHLRRAAELRGSGALASCAAIRDGVLAAECVTRAAAALGAAGSLAPARAACDTLTDDLWASECRFRLSEAAAAPVAQRAELCRVAGRFRDECGFHLVRSEAGRGVAVAERTSLDATLAELERVATDSLPAVASASGQPRESLARLFWHEAAFALFLAAAERGVLLDAPAFPPITPAADGTERRAAFEDTRAMLTARLLLEDRTRPAPRTLAEARPGAPTGTPLDASHAPLLPADPKGPRRYPTIRIGEVPPPLGNSRCALDGSERAALVTLWAAEGAPWDRSRALVIDASSNASAIVRAQAVDAMEWKVFFHHATDASVREEVTSALTRVSETDPDARVRARASELVAAIARGARPGRWGALAGLCERGE